MIYTYASLPIASQPALAFSKLSVDLLAYQGDDTIVYTFRDIANTAIVSYIDGTNRDATSIKNYISFTIDDLHLITTGTSDSPGLDMVDYTKASSDTLSSKNDWTDDYYTTYTDVVLSKDDSYLINSLNGIGVNIKAKNTLLNNKYYLSVQVIEDVYGNDVKRCLISSDNSLLIIVTTNTVNIVIYKYEVSKKQFVLYQKLDTDDIGSVDDIYISDNSKRIFVLDATYDTMFIYEYSSKYKFDVV